MVGSHQLRNVLLRVGVGISLIAAGCSDGDPDDTAPSLSVSVGDVTVTQSHIGPSGFVDDVVNNDGDLYVLASTKSSGSGDLLLSSADGGASWAEHRTGLTDDGQPPDYSLNPQPSARLFASDEAMLVAASRTVISDAGEPATRETQTTHLSTDRGQTWAPLTLDAPAGSDALVGGLTSIDDTLVIVGTLQRSDVPYPNGFDMSAYDESFDAAVWTAPVGSLDFARVISPVFDDVSGSQTLESVVRFENRLITTGTGSESRLISFSSNDGETWTALDQSEIDTTSISASTPPVATARSLQFASYSALVELAPSSTTWTTLNFALDPNPGHDYERALPYGANLATIDDDHSFVATWVEDTACDCSVAWAGSVSPTAMTSTEVQFDSCDDRSLRGWTRIGQVYRVGSSFAALATCDDLNRSAASVVVTNDDGLTWHTARLTLLNPDDAHDELITTWDAARYPFRSAPTDNGFIAAFIGSTPSDAVDALESGSGYPKAGPIVILRAQSSR